MSGKEISQMSGDNDECILDANIFNKTISVVCDWVFCK